MYIAVIFKTSNSLQLACSILSVNNQSAGFRRGVSAPRPPTKGREENESKNEEVWPSGEMVEILIKENSALKHELENCYQRVEKSQKVSYFTSLLNFT